MSDAADFVEHYDAWLEEFDRWRVEKEQGVDDPTFIFVGPSGYSFPREAKRRFRERLDSLRRELRVPAALQEAPLATDYDQIVNDHARYFALATRVGYDQRAF
mgnify:CR=1 FL=1